MNENLSAPAKIALIIGGAGGIGKATSKLLNARGYRVLIADLPSVISEASRGECLSEFTFLEVDVLSKGSVDSMFAEVGAKFGGLDVLVNSAGNIHPALSSEADEIAWDRLLNIHLSGTFRCCQGAYPLLEASQSAAILNLSSILAGRGVSGRASYASAKAGVEGLTRVLAVEWARAGIRVNCVAPGYVATSMNAEAVRVGKLDVEQLETRIPLARLASADEIAQGIAFLISSEAAYVTGQVLVIDGGLSISGEWDHPRREASQKK